MHIRRSYSIGSTILANPLVVASCPATEDRERLLRCASAGAAAAILKSSHLLGEKPQDAGSRKFQLTERGLWGTSALSRELLDPKSAADLYLSVQSETDMILVPSIAGFTLKPQAWLNTIKFWEFLHPPCIQLDLFYIREDLSVPHNLQLLHNLISRLSEQTEVELMPKLNLNLRPGAAHFMLENSGIACWSLLDSVRVPLPAWSSGQSSSLPSFRNTGGVNSASLFGGWQLPLTMEYTGLLGTLTRLPILAGGGVNTAEDIITLLDLGAASIQVASAILTNGSEWINNMLFELDELLQEADNLEPNQKDLPESHCVVDTSLCQKCDICSRQLMCPIPNKGETDRSKCEGCGFCVDLCPTGALSLIVDNEIPKTTSKEI